MSALLVFMRKGCGPCENLAGQLGRADLNAISRQLTVVTNVADPGEMGIPEGLRVVPELDNGLSIPLSIQSTPFAIAIDPDGIVRVANVPNTFSDLRRLAASVTPGASTR